MMKKLELWQEAVGKIEEVKEEGEIAILNLENVGKVAINNDRQLISKLKKAIGQRIGILRTDIPGHEYILRELT